jgi:hypothetical protein
MTVRLRVGQRVVAIDPAGSGDLGRVALRLTRDGEDCETTAYLVRWEAGGESRCERSSLRPVRIGDLLTRV